MKNKPTLQAAMFAALLAFICTLLMGFGVRSPDPALTLQPSTPVGTAVQFAKVINTYPDHVLRFFSADSLFVISYLIVFAGLFIITSRRTPVLAWIGLGAGLLAGLLDATENTFFINYALLVKNGVLLTDPELPLIYHIANLKWMGAFSAFFAFGLGFPRDELLGWLISTIMVAFPIVGVLGIFSPFLYELRGLFLLVGMPLFALDFWLRVRQE